jgi:hypothetical protein
LGASLGRFRGPDFSAASQIEEERSIKKPGKFVKKSEIFRLLRRGGLASNEYVHVFVKNMVGRGSRKIANEWKLNFCSVAI